MKTAVENQKDGAQCHPIQKPDNVFEYRKQKAAIQLQISVCQNELYKYLISIDIRKSIAESFALDPEAEFRYSILSDDEMREVKQYISRFKESQKQLYNLEQLGFK